MNQNRALYHGHDFGPKTWVRSEKNSLKVLIKLQQIFGQKCEIQNFNFSNRRARCEANMVQKINAFKIAGEAFSQISIKFDPEMVTIPEEFQEISG